MISAGYCKVLASPLEIYGKLTIEMNALHGPAYPKLTKNMPAMIPRARAASVLPFFSYTAHIDTADSEPHMMKKYAMKIVTRLPTLSKQKAAYKADILPQAPHTPVIVKAMTCERPRLV